MISRKRRGGWGRRGIEDGIEEYGLFIECKIIEAIKKEPRRGRRES
jgi:hypothetical protein